MISNNYSHSESSLRNYSVLVIDAHTMESVGFYPTLKLFYKKYNVDLTKITTLKYKDDKYYFDLKYDHDKRLIHLFIS